MHEADAHSTETTRAMAEMVVSLEARHIPADVLDLITKAFVDGLGCALVGADQPEGQIARGWVESLGGTPDSTLLGAGGTRAPAAMAALANGVMMHALDYDDFSLKRMMHPTVVFAPVVLALGEREGSSGMDVIVAYAAGYETAARVAKQLIPDHYARGWHSTSTIGGLGAAAAAARLLGLDADGVAMAVAIAASSAAGLRNNFGTMVKPLHAGNAAFHGVAAAELAARGYTASKGIFDGERSYQEVYRNEETPTLSPDGFSLDTLELVESGITFKRYTCCGAIHAALDATLELRAEHGLTPDKVASMRCAVHPRAPEILIHHTASTPEQGRFCVEYSLAVAIADGHAGVPQYTEERLADPVVQDLARRTEVYVDESLAFNEGAATAISNSVVTIETTDGETLVHRVPPHRPMSWDEIERKFRSSAALGIGEDGVEAALATARSLPELDNVGVLLQAFSGAASAKASK
jgi:2-methylcitrate dehydratase PrpD